MRKQQIGRAFEATAMLGAVALVGSAAALAARPGLGALLLFAGLLVWAENAAVLLPTRVTISPSFMVVVASLAAFDRHGSVLGAGIVGLCGGIALDKLRQRRFWNVGFNCAQYVLAGAGAAAAEGLAAGRGAPQWAAMTVAGLAFAIVNILLVLPAVALETGSSPRRVWADMAPALPNYVAFGLLGIVIGELYTRLGPLAVLLLVTPLVVARSFFTALLRQRQSYQRLEGLYGFTRSVSGALDIDTVIISTLEEAERVLRARRVELVVLDGDGPDAVRYAADEGGTVAALRWTLDSASPAALVIESGIGTTFRRGAVEPATRGWLVVEGMDEVLAVPVSGEHGIVGALVVADRMDGGCYGAEDLQTLETLANHAGIALRNGTLVARLRHESVHDSLTGLLNRAGFAAAVDDAVASGEPVGVLLLDLDRFKEINDTLGHESGDTVLREAARRLASALPDASVARLGGDEFGVLVPCGTDNDAVVAPVLRALDGPFVVADLALDVSAGLGLARFPEHGADSSTLLQKADIAMYASKQSKRPFEVYHPEHDQNTPRRLLLAAELRRAIEQDELAVYYQPKAELPSGRVLGAEALVRWFHPEHGFVAPDEFIPLAEHTGSIGALTSRVLETAVRQLAEWRDRGLDLSMAVNLSARVLVDTDLPDEVMRVLVRHRVPAQALVLEITESHIMSDPVRSIGVLEELSTMGVSLSIDDFGTGYSSLSYLKKLPVTEVKVDRSFVMNMASDPADAAIVRSTVDLARNLGLHVVAEGVEDRFAWDRLAELGCQVAQGYFLSRPVSADAFEQWLTGYSEVALPVG